MDRAAVLIDARGVGVRFQFDRARRVVTPMAARLRRHGDETWGLRDVDIVVRPGQAVALLGRSGSGKTTLLRLLAGVLPADAGGVEVARPVGALLAADAGLLHPLTGRENAALLAALHGIPRRDVGAAIERAAEFSELGPAFDRPVAAWSQGMRARLGLAVALTAEPRVLLLDEVHEALDGQFRTRLREKVDEVRARGGAVVAAGHDLALLGDLCDEALLFERGRCIARNRFEAIVSATPPRRLYDEPRRASTAS